MCHGVSSIYRGDNNSSSRGCEEFKWDYTVAKSYIVDEVGSIFEVDGVN